MPLVIGTSGWQYRDWRERFYPKGLRQADWLEHYAARFAAVEVNNTFYRLPEKATFESWAQRTPADFVFAVKMSRYLTHLKRLRDPADPVQRFMEAARGLGPKLGPVLVQLPPNLQASPAALDAALGAFPPDVRVAVEFRHDSWFVPDTYSVLEARGAALCLADSPRRKTPVRRTAPWGFLRLHEGAASPRPCYGRRALTAWAERLSANWSAEEEVFVFFNNDTLGCAVRDAAVFAREAERAGLHPTRVPATGEVRAG